MAVGTTFLLDWAPEGTPFLCPPYLAGLPGPLVCLLDALDSLSNPLTVFPEPLGSPPDPWMAFPDPLLVSQTTWVDSLAGHPGPDPLLLSQAPRVAFRIAG